MKKKWSSLLLSMALAGSALAGCGGGGEQASSTKDNSKKSGQEAKADPVTLKFYHWYNEEEGNWKKVIGEFENINPDIKVESIWLSESNTSKEATEKMDLMYASGEQMDVIMLSNVNDYSQRVAVGMLEPLNSYIEKDGYNYDEEYKVDTNIDGTYYALPGKYQEYFTILNKNHLDEVGLPVPTDWTWDEFQEYAKKLTKGEGANKRYGTFFWDREQYNRLLMMNKPENQGILTPDGQSNLDDPLVKLSLEMKYKMENVDKSATPYADNISQKMSYRDEYFNQKASMLLTGGWMIREVGGTSKYPANFKTAFAPLPVMKKGDPAHTNVSLDLVGVAANSKNKEAAYKFVRWFTTEGQVVQGKFLPSWKKADVNRVLDNLIDGTDSPEMVDKESLKFVIENSKASKLDVPASYQAEANKLFGEEVQKYLLGEQDIEATMAASKEKIQKLIDANKK